MRLPWPFRRALVPTVTPARWDAPVQVGVIEARLDGTPRTWHLWRRMEEYSDALLEYHPGYTALWLYGTPATPTGSKDLLSILVEWRDGPPRARAWDHDLVGFTPDGPQRPHWTSQGMPEGPDIRLTALDPGPRTNLAAGRVEGTFAAVMGRVAVIHAPLEPADTRQIEGRFAADLLVLRLD